MTEVQDIETIHQDIPLEVFVSSCSEDTLKCHRKGQGVDRKVLYGDTLKMEPTIINQTIKHILLNTWLCEKNALVEK